jgi:hypothetical protein
VTLEVPLEDEWVEAYAVGGVGRLEYEKNGNGVDGVFESSAKKAGQVWAGEDPSIAQAGVECAGVAASAGDGVSATRPDLNFVAALLRADLGRAQGRDQRNTDAEEEPYDLFEHDLLEHDLLNSTPQGLNEGSRYRNGGLATNGGRDGRGKKQVPRLRIAIRNADRYASLGMTVLVSCLN